MKTFTDKVAVITGAGSGLGQALAVQLHQAGAWLALCDVDPAGLDETLALLGSPSTRVSLHTVDVSDPEQMQRFTVGVLKHYGQADLLFNNAGITLTPTIFEQIPDERFRRMIEINMWGVYHGVRAFLPHLKTRPEAAIVNISSLAGLVGLYGYTPYAMSKFAVRGLSEALAMELAGTPVHVMVVHPGGVKTNIIRNAPDLSAAGRDSAHQAFTRAATLTAESAARQILHGVRRRRARLILGADAQLVHALYRLFPQNYPAVLGAVFSRAVFK
jgi:NAD(P)-dependent dehydrogenase (short-subunit alcohol dehydrogenase family)